MLLTHIYPVVSAVELRRDMTVVVFLTVF